MKPLQLLTRVLYLQNIYCNFFSPSMLLFWERGFISVGRSQDSNLGVTFAHPHSLGTLSCSQRFEPVNPHPFFAHQAINILFFLPHSLTAVAPPLSFPHSRFVLLGEAFLPVTKRLLEGRGCKRPAGQLEWHEQPAQSSARHAAALNQLKLAQRWMVMVQSTRLSADGRT